MIRDLYNNIEVAISTAPVAATAAGGAVNGTGVDLQGFDSASVILEMSATGTATGKIQESDAAASGFADAAAADVQGSQGISLVVGSVVKLGYIGAKRYIRSVITPTVDAAAISSVVVKGNANNLKVS